jgi:flagellar biosynthesis protein FliQ
MTDALYETLRLSIWLVTPLLLATLLASLLGSLLQSLTLLQDSMLSTLPRLVALAVAILWFRETLWAALVSFASACWSAAP